MQNTTEEYTHSKNAIETLYRQIGHNVKLKRMEKGLSQLDLTHRMGFKSVSLVSQAEISYKNQHFSIKHLYIIASILECDIQDFFRNIEVEKIDWDI